MARVTISTQNPTTVTTTYAVTSGSLPSGMSITNDAEVFLR
jgi:hypothetical protein